MLILGGPVDKSSGEEKSKSVVTKRAETGRDIP